MSKNGCLLIIGIKNLAKYLEVSAPTVSQYIRLGMPCGRIGARWHFHLDNVDRWLIALTSAKYRGKKEPDDFE
jgi:phage terminase Nu1 subunit (DNA packaging protein)